MRPALALIALVLVGCQSVASTGAVCARAADCTSPLTCRLGRCRTECVDNRDCGAGRLCLHDVTGAGACAVEQDTCSDTCTAGLTCRGGLCLQTCGSDAECPSDGRCTSGVCVLSLTDAGSSDDGGATDVGPPDGGLVHCALDRDCPSGLACDVDPSAGSLAYSLCRPTCTQDAECPSGSRCVPADYRVDAGGIGICTPVCSPVTGEGCPAHTRCSVVDAMPAYASCLLWATFVGDGCDCSHAGSLDCGPGFECRNWMPGHSVCARACVLGTNCPDGSPCEADVPAYSAGAVSYGYCRTPTTPSCP